MSDDALGKQPTETEASSTWGDVLGDDEQSCLALTPPRGNDARAKATPKGKSKAKAKAKCKTKAASRLVDELDWACRWCNCHGSSENPLKFAPPGKERPKTLPRTRKDRFEDDVCRAFLKARKGGEDLAALHKEIKSSQEAQQTFNDERQSYIDERNALQGGRARPQLKDTTASRDMRMYRQGREMVGILWPLDVWKAEFGEPPKGRKLDEIMKFGKKGPWVS